MNNKNAVFSIISAVMMVLLPVCIFISILFLVLTQPAVYTFILKHTDFVSSFVKAKNIEITRNIQNEIDEKVGLASYILEYETIKKQYEDIKNKYNTINRQDEYDKLQQQYEELKNLSYNDVKNAFASRELFVQHKKAQLQNIQNKINAIEQYRESNETQIEKAKDELDAIEDTYEDAADTLREKQEEADEIVQKHKNTFAARFNDDLEVINSILTQLLNDYIIDKQIHALAEKYISFFTHYSDIKDEYIYEYTNTTDPNQEKVKQIMLPDIKISLFVTDEKGNKRHLLSDIMVEEIRKLDNIKNKGFFTALFTFSDTTLGEFIGKSFLSKSGFTLSSGTLYKQNVIFSGKTAETIICIIKLLSACIYFVYGTVALTIAYKVYVLLSTADKLKKLLWLKRILVYPSVIILGAITAGIFVPYVLIHTTMPISAALRQFYGQLTFNAGLYILLPSFIVFSILLVTGLIIRKIINKQIQNSVR